MCFRLAQDSSKNVNQKDEKEITTRRPAGPGVTVEFNVVIHDEWKISMETSQGSSTVHIQFGAQELGLWEWNCVDMQPVKLAMTYACNATLYPVST